MLRASLKAADKLKDALVARCKESGLGFRLQSLPPDIAPDNVIIKLDKIRPGDEVIIDNGIAIFTAENNIVKFTGCELDYCDDSSEPGFCLKITDETL